MTDFSGSASYYYASGQTTTIYEGSLSTVSSGFSPTEGQLFSGTVARFNDSDPFPDTYEYSATIAWGDGTPIGSASVVADPNGGYDVVGSHTYAEEGNTKTIVVSVADDNGASLSFSYTTNVADAPLSRAGSGSITLQEIAGQAFSNGIVSFFDADQYGVASDYTVTATWGDGTTSSGSAVANTNGGFDAVAGHTYATAGTYSGSVLIHDAGGSSLTVPFTAVVNGPNVTIASTADGWEEADSSHSTPVPLQYTVTRDHYDSSNPNQSLVVNYHVSGGTATASDYQAPSGSVTIPGGYASAVIQIVPVDDEAVTGDETVDVTLDPASSSGGSTPAYNVGSPSTAECRIREDDVKLAIGNQPQATSYSDTGFVPVNANDDNGSPITDGNGNVVPIGIPQVRDFNVNPIPNEKDLVPIQLVVGPQNGMVRLTDAVLSGDNGAIKVWDTPTKQNEIVLPHSWPAGQLPQTLWVEGVAPSTEENSVLLDLQYIDANGVERDDSKVHLTVTPVLKNLSATAKAGEFPDYRFSNVQGDLIDSTNAAPNPDNTYTLSATMDEKNFPAELSLMQTARFTNNLPNGVGANIQDNTLPRTQYSWDFPAPNAGKPLIDAQDQQHFPFYTTPLGNRSFNGDLITLTDVDAPSLRLITPPIAVLPTPNHTTTIDVTYVYRTYAVCEFADHSIYFLGYTDWNIRYQGDVKAVQGGYTFVPGANDADNSSTGLVESHADIPIVGPIANFAPPAWR
ncbi:MAG: hypothetical protein JWL69_4380 [Phycisphaerales bacterium]|nr:hypothetical protein [Phycisphaerales bacterium]